MPTISFKLTEDEAAIMDARAGQLGVSRSDLLRELIWMDGICMSSHPLTSKIRTMNDGKRVALLEALRAKVEAGERTKPDAWGKKLEEVAGEVKNGFEESVADAVIEDLLGGDE